MNELLYQIMCNIIDCYDFDILFVIQNKETIIVKKTTRRKKNQTLIKQIKQSLYNLLKILLLCTKVDHQVKATLILIQKK